MRDDKERLRDINEAIEKIEKYVSIGYQAFTEDISTLELISHKSGRPQNLICRF